MNRAVSLDEMGRTKRWRVRWSYYSRVSFREEMWEWAQANCSGKIRITPSGIRFENHTDALMCWLTFQ